MKRIRLALGGAIAGACVVGFAGGFSGNSWQPYAGAALGFAISYWWLWHQEEDLL